MPYSAVLKQQADERLLGALHRRRHGEWLGVSVEDLIGTHPGCNSPFILLADGGAQYLCKLWFADDRLPQLTELTSEDLAAVLLLSFRIVS
jgi:hypothetical protein